MIRAAIFDMDGLMFDTERLFLRSLDEYVGPVTGVAFPLDRVLSILGCNHRDFEARFPVLFGTKITPARCTELVTEWVRREIETNGVPVKPGLYDTLDALKADGLRLALATGTKREIATIYLEMTNTLPYFDALVCGDQVAHGKPDPEIFLTAAKALSVDPGETVVFEDSYNGLLAAQKGGFLSVCIPDLIDPVPRLETPPFASFPVLSDAVPLIRYENGAPATLLPYTLDALTAYYRGFEADPALCENPKDFRPYTYSEEAVERHFAARATRTDRADFLIGVGGIPVGEIALKRIDSTARCATAEIHLRADVWKGRGVGTKAMRLLLDHAFGTLGLRTVFADALLKNARSLRMIRSLGFTHTGDDGRFAYFRLDAPDRSSAPFLPSGAVDISRFS